MERSSKEADMCYSLFKELEILGRVAQIDQELSQKQPRSLLHPLNLFGVSREEDEHTSIEVMRATARAEEAERKSKAMASELADAQTIVTEVLHCLQEEVDLHEQRQKLLSGPLL